MYVQAVPSLNILYTEEKGYVTADEAKKDNLKEMKLSGKCAGVGDCAYMI